MWDNPASLSTGGTWTGTYNLGGGTSDMKITLAWTDYWAASGAIVSIQNDLHLRVTAPDGRVFSGIKPGYSVTGGSYDVRNTVEGVESTDRQLHDHRHRQQRAA